MLPLQKKITSTLRFLILLIVLSLSTGVRAQFFGATPGQNEEEVPEWPEDELNRRTPRGSISGFIAAVAEDNYKKASAYFNLEEVPPEFENAAELAQTLETLLDKQGQILPYTWISDKPGGKPGDDLPPNLDRVGKFIVEGEVEDLLLEEVKGPDGGPLWLISSDNVETLAVINNLGEVVLPLERILPSYVTKYKWAGAPVAHWIATILLAAGSYLIVWAIVSFFLWLIPRLWKRAAKESVTGVLEAFALPLKLYLAVLLFVDLSQQLGVSIVVRQKLSGISVIIGLLAFLILLWRLTGYISNFSKEKMTVRENASGVSVVLFLNRAAKIGIIVFGIIAVLGAFGVDVTTGLAALGIGGIALALGAQKTIENFVGSVTLITDQPIRVGDFCKVGDTIGVVEKIGMRSTRIRTLARTVVTIPNGEFSSGKIENYAHRDKFWFNTTLSLRYETTPDQIRYLLVELRSVLYSHPMVSPEPARVRFAGLGADSLNLDIFAYIMVTTFDDFLEVREDLLLRIMDVVESSGTSFAFPSQTLYFAKDQGLSKEKSESAEQKVHRWREKGEMPIPKFNPEEIEKIKDSIPYPPEGSSNPRETGTEKIPGL